MLVRVRTDIDVDGVYDEDLLEMRRASTKRAVHEYCAGVEQQVQLIIAGK